MLAQTHYSRLFTQRLAEFRTKLVEELAMGLCQDHAAYRAVIGRLQGLDDAITISHQLDQDLNGDS